MKNRKMGKGILVVGLVLYGAMDVVAQSVTYSHDAAKMNQITVGEIGSGSLTPGLYYQAFYYICILHYFYYLNSSSTYAGRQ